MLFARRLRLGPVVIALGLGLPPAASALTCDWTGAVSVAWADPANWSNCAGQVPGTADTAAITNVANQPVVSTATPVGGLSLGSGTTLTIASGGNLTLDGTTTGAGNILIDGTLTWVAGVMGGTGVTTVQPGGLLSLFGNPSKLLDRNVGVMPGGATTMTGGNSSLIITDTHIFANSGLYHIQNGSNITGAGRFENLPNGIFRTSISPGLVNITVGNWINTGLVEVQAGTLSFAAGTFVHGGTYTFSGTRLYLSTGTHTVIGTIQGTTLEINDATVDFAPQALVANMVGHIEIRSFTTFNTGEALVFASMFLDGGTILGADNITSSAFSWNSGTLSGTGTMTLAPGGDLTIDNFGPHTIDRDFFNNGNILMEAPGFLFVSSNKTFHNLSPGIFYINNDCQIVGEGTFVNSGSFVRTGVPGATLVDLDFQNAGTVVIPIGMTTFHEYHQSAGTTAVVFGAELAVVHEVLHLEGGSLTGVGQIHASVEASGTATIEPGESVGTITVNGDYRQSFPAAYQAELGSPASDLIAASGQALLGGILYMTLTGPPVLNTDYVLLSYASRIGKFGDSSISAPPPPGSSWAMRYGATAFSLRAQALLPNDPLNVDVRTVAGGFGNQNGVFEPGEIVPVDPTWFRGVAGSIVGVTGTASNFVGPMGGTYDIVDAGADYGTIDPGGSPGVNCADVGATNCYTLSVSDPPTRPALHWDTTFDETLNNSDPATYTLHIGRSFLDVPTSDGFYRFIETLLHNQVTTGCGGDNYCPTSFVTRAQMAVFLMVSKFGPSYLPPEATGTVFTDVPLGSFAAAFIEDIAARQITSGCGGGNYCPGDSATREQMSVFLLRTLEGPLYVPPDCTEPPTFTDVPCSSGFAKWIEELVLRGITAGCGGGLYCPADPVTRGQMAVFLTATFSLLLNGP